MRFKPNRAQKDAYIVKINALRAWLEGEGRDLGAQRALTGSVYFQIEGTRYRVASHKPGLNHDGETTFHASPLRAPEIAAALKAGLTLDGRGKVKD